MPCVSASKSWLAIPHSTDCSWKSSYVRAVIVATTVIAPSSCASMTSAVPSARKLRRNVSAETSWSWLSWRLKKKMNRLPLEEKVLSENDRIAAELRERFREHDIFCVNLISSPGSGKTTLLEKTLAGFPPNERVAVLTGDIQTDNDAQRLARYGFPVRQITTGGACH